jgi:hypothetical protein
MVSMDRMERTLQAIVRTYSDIECLNGSAKAMLRLAHILRATNVFPLAFLEYHTFVISMDVEPSLFNLLLVEPADEDLTPSVTHLLTKGKRSWPGSPWCVGACNVAIEERSRGCGCLFRRSDLSWLAAGLLLRLFWDEV